MILVTGADGFIGSHLVEHLVRSGNSVRALALYNSWGTRGWLDRLDPQVAAAVEIHSGDVRDRESLRGAMRGCERVAHLAALIAVPYSYVAPESYLDTNVRGTLNVLALARELELECVVQVSSSEVYGSAQHVPMREDHPLCAQSPYAASKIAADQLALSFHHSYGTPVCVVRPFNTYGPRQSARAVIPSVIAQLAAGRQMLRLGSLFPTRDFCYVEDTVRGLASALRAPSALGQVVHLGTGYEVSIGDLVAQIAEIMGSQVQVESEAERTRPDQSEVERLCCDPSKALQLLDWKPEYAGPEGLRRGLERTSAWFRDPENLSATRFDRYQL